jgi:hypothetical protein
MLDTCVECWILVWNVGYLCGMLDTCVECWILVWNVVGFLGMLDTCVECWNPSHIGSSLGMNVQGSD